MYDEQTGANDDHFEVIYLSLDDEDPSACGDLQMPWWVCSVDKKHARSLAYELFDTGRISPAIVAFGLNGHLETRESNLANKACLNSKYPFIQDMEEAVCKELNIMYQWDLEYYVDHGRPSYFFSD